MPLSIDRISMSKKTSLRNIFKGRSDDSSNLFYCRSFSRLKEKYIIHAQDKKADLLEFLVKRFNNRSLLHHIPEVSCRKKYKLNFRFFSN